MGAESKNPEDLSFTWLPQGVLPKLSRANSLTRHRTTDILGMVRLVLPRFARSDSLTMTVFGVYVPRLWFQLSTLPLNLDSGKRDTLLQLLLVE